MVTAKEIWLECKKFGGISVPYNPTKDTGIYEIILPTTDHKRQCCIYVTDDGLQKIPDQVVKLMRTISDNRYRVSTKKTLTKILLEL